MVEPIPFSRTATRSPYPKNVVTVGIDKLRFGIPIKSISLSAVEYIAKNFDDLCEQGAKRLSKTGHYGSRIKLFVGKGMLLLECMPVKENERLAFTAEFNPNRFKPDELKEVFAKIRYALGHDAPFLLRQATVSRIDINVDFALDLRGLLIEVGHKRGGMTVMRKLNGKAELGTVYIGSEGSNGRVRMYDKGQKNLVDFLRPHADAIAAALEWHTTDQRWPITIEDIRKKASEPPLWRIEIENRPTKPMPLSRIDEVASCFDKLRLLALTTDVAPFDTNEGRLFVMAAGLVGIPVALQAMDANAQRRFKSALARRPAVEWWDAERYARCIRFALQRLRPLLPKTTRPLPVRGKAPLGATTRLPAPRNSSRTHPVRKRRNI